MLNDLSYMDCAISYLAGIRPRRRLLEAFTTDVKIIRLTRRRVAFFRRRRRSNLSTATCDAASFKNFPGVILPDLRTCGLLLGKGREGSPVDKILHTPLSVSSLSLKLFSHILTLTSRPVAPAFIILPPPRDQSLSSRLQTS